jgi:transcriptional regulator with XRE-family HTH domain
MGFKENLKYELAYKNMMVKELAAKTGISRHTLDNYLSIRGHIPTIDIAVKIAQALGVSVEYLATGEEAPNTSMKMNNEIVSLVQTYCFLNEDDRKMVEELIQIIKKHRHKKN